MSEDQISIRKWLENLDTGKYLKGDVKTMIEAGWYDWFCQDKSLISRLNKMLPMIVRVCKSSKIDIDKSYLLFKNNMPVHGKLYDDFRICDLETGDVIYTVIPRTGHESLIKEGKAAQVWGNENDFKGAIVDGPSTKVIYSFFGV
jgi:hypothetical protein